MVYLMFVERGALVKIKYIIKKIKSFFLAKNERLKELHEVFYNLSKTDAKKVDKLLMAYFANADFDDISPDEYLQFVLSQYDIDETIGSFAERKKLIERYCKSNHDWITTENTFCIIGYLFTIVSLFIEIFASAYELKNSTTTIFQFLSVIICLVMSIGINSWFSKKNSFNSFSNVFNRYIPSIAIITLLLFYFAKRCIPITTLSMGIFIVGLLISIVLVTILLINKFKKVCRVKTDIKSIIDSEPDIFKTDIFEEGFAPPKGGKINLIGLTLPTNQSIYFASKWHEIHDRYESARLLLRKTQEKNYKYWFDSIDDPEIQQAMELIIKSTLYESALINYNMLVDLTWTWLYVSAEYVLYKFDENGNVINAEDITGIHTIDEAYAMLRNTENGVSTPHAEGNPFKYLKIMRPEFSCAVDAIIDFWREFSNSEIRNLYNFSKHKGKLRYSEIEALKPRKSLSITINGNECPSDVSDVEKVVVLEDCIKSLIDFDDNMLYPYMKNLIKELNNAVNPSPLVFF